MLTSINHEISNFLIHHVHDMLVFSIKETETHYLIAMDIPGLPVNEARIREENKSVYVECMPDKRSSQKKTYLESHFKNKACQTIYQEGILWLAMPKYVNEYRIGAVS